MPITVTTTDGRRVQFPDGTSREEMTAAMKKLPPLGPAPTGETPQSPVPPNIGILDSIKFALANADQSGGRDMVPPVRTQDEAGDMLRDWATTVGPSAVLPGVLKFGGPAVGRAVTSPVGGALIGGGIGYATGGLPGAAAGVVAGSVGQLPPVAERVRRLFGRSAQQQMARGMSEAGRTAAATEGAAVGTATERTADDIINEAIRRERLKNPDFWSDEPLPPRTPPGGPQRPPGASEPVPSTSTSTAPPSAAGASEGVAEEVLKRERQSYLDREYQHLQAQRGKGQQARTPTPREYIEEGAVSERAGERLNLGDEAERVRTYGEWKALEQKARAAGDVETAEYANKRARQRLHISKKEESRRAKGN